MWKIRKWFDKKSASKEEYDKEKIEFEMAIGKPFIALRIELPEGFDDQRKNFLNLESNEDFLDEVKDLIKKNLLWKREAEKAAASGR
jgi:hypothetical protein